MKKIILIIAILLFKIFIANAKDKNEMNRVPKVKSFEIGYRSITQSDYAINNGGYTFLFDYAWQLSGFHGSKKKSFISVPLGLTFMNLGDEANARILSYGWTVKHDLKIDKKRIPFVGYGLLLNQLSIEGVEGKVMGHQTRFDFGYDFIKREHFNPFVKLEYSMTRYYQLAESEGKKVSFWELKTGFRF